ncbi:MAG: hypothetical protein DYH12_09470, partial [Sorangiineae bacterium PRO1]|nr:hypothetical protein [Sorangiineae bacterium PRO1]
MTDAEEQPESERLLDALALPEGRKVLSAREVAELARASRNLHVVGAEGSAPALVSRALALAGARVLYVAPD